jgi:hypothetical protein
MVIGLVFLVMIVGLIIYMLAVNSKVSEVGKIMFWTAILALLLGADKLLVVFRGL